MVLKPWLWYGIVAVLVCIALYFFYLLAYLPIAYAISPDATPGWALAVPLFTGHLFPLYSHFVVEGSSVVPFFCPETQSECISWISADVAQEEHLSCISWDSYIDGTKGCCTEVIMTATDTCVTIVETSVFWVLALLVMGIYFGIGATISRLYSWRK